MKCKKLVGFQLFKGGLFCWILMWSAIAMTEGNSDVTYYSTAAAPTALTTPIASHGKDVALAYYRWPGVSDIVVNSQTLEGQWFTKQTIRVNAFVQSLHYVGQTLMAQSCDTTQCYVLVFERVQDQLQWVQSISAGSATLPTRWMTSVREDEMILEIDSQYDVYRRGAVRWEKHESLSMIGGYPNFTFAISEEDLFVLESDTGKLLIYNRHVDGSWADMVQEITLPKSILRLQIVLDDQQALIYDSMDSSDIGFLLVKRAGSWVLDTPPTSFFTPSLSGSYKKIFMKGERIVVQTRFALELWRKNEVGQWFLVDAISNWSRVWLNHDSTMVDNTLLLLFEDQSFDVNHLALTATSSGWVEVQGPFANPFDVVNLDVVISPGHVFVHSKGNVIEQIEVFERCEVGCSNRRVAVIERPRDARYIIWWRRLYWFDGQLFIHGEQNGREMLFVYEVVNDRWVLAQSIEMDAYDVRGVGQSLFVYGRDGLKRMEKVGGSWVWTPWVGSNVKCEGSPIFNDDSLDCVGPTHVDRLYFDAQLNVLNTVRLVDRPSSVESFFHGVEKDEIWAMKLEHAQCDEVTLDIYHQDSRWQVVQSLSLGLECVDFDIKDIATHGDTGLIHIKVDGHNVFGFLERTEQSWSFRGWFYAYRNASSFVLGPNGYLWGMQDHYMFGLYVLELYPWKNELFHSDVIEHQIEGIEDQNLIITPQQVDANTSYQLINQPTHGVLVDEEMQLIPVGRVHRHIDLFAMYQPNANHHGADSVSFLVKSLGQQAFIETWSITVQPVNDRPEIQPLEYTARAGQMFDGQLVGEDSDGDILTYEIVSQPPGGGVTLLDNVKGTFAYDVPENAEGRLGFEYRAFDGKVFSKAKYVSVDVMAAPQDEPMMPDRRQRAQQSGGGSAIGCSSPFGQPVSMGSMLGVWAVFALGRRRARRRRFVDGGRA